MTDYSRNMKCQNSDDSYFSNHVLAMYSTVLEGRLAILHCFVRNCTKLGGRECAVSGHNPGFCMALRQTFCSAFAQYGQLYRQ